MKKIITLLLIIPFMYGISLAQTVSVDVPSVGSVLSNGQSAVSVVNISNTDLVTPLNWTIDLTGVYSNGTNISFTKADLADWKLTSNQDRITDNVWLTRDAGLLFNAKSETASSVLSPNDTEWALGLTSATIGGAYTDFTTVSGGDPTTLIGSTVSLHLITDDLYFDVDITSWTPDGGFVYTRRQIMSWLSATPISGVVAPGASVAVNVTLDASQLATGIHNGSILINSDDPVTPVTTVTASLEVLSPGVISIVETALTATVVAGTTTPIDLTINNTGAADLLWNNNDPVTFTKVNFADPTLASNQDRVSDNVWITRGNRMGLFNAVSESLHDRNVSPVGTTWASGTTSSPTSGYGPFRPSTRPHNSIAGRTYSLHLTQEDIYYDINFLQWTSGRAGGGFSYLRTTPLPQWLSPVANTGTVVGGATAITTYNLDATNLNAGTYTYNLEIRSNDATQPLITVPVTLTVTGTPTISAVTTFDYGNSFLGVANVYPLVISNTGTDVLNISDIASDNAEFVTLTSVLSIAPGASATVPVTYTAATLGAVTGTLTITSDDLVNPSWAISLAGTGLDLPAISVSSFSLTEVLAAGASNTQTITLENTGASDLTWSLASFATPSLSNDGFRVQFSKANNANVNLPENRDEVIPGVELTRGNSGRIYDFNGAALEWAKGTTASVINSGGVYSTNWRTAMGSSAADLPGQTISLHIIAADVYVDIDIEAWQSDGRGGMVTYSRSAPMQGGSWLSGAATISGFTSGTIAPGATEEVTVTFDASLLTNTGVNAGQLVFSTNIPAQPTVTVDASLEITNGLVPSLSTTSTTITNSLLAGGANTTTYTITNNGTGELLWNLGDLVIPGAPAPVVITKQNGADMNLIENQDRITDKVWITRSTSKGIFNIAQEGGSAGNNSTSPIGTEWKYGYSDDVSTTGGYVSWFNVHNTAPTSLIGKPVSVHLIEDDLYYDILFTGWQRNSNGGGFGYIRSTPGYRINWVDKGPVSSGVIAAGASVDIILSWDATNVVAGIYNADVVLSTNDPLQPETVISTSLEVLGNPQINIVETALDFGDGFIGYNNDLELTIENLGTDVLNISDIAFDDPAFSVDATTQVVAAGQVLLLPVHFTPTLQQAYSGNVTITSDDAVNPTISIPLTGNGILPPNLIVDVTSIDELLFIGETSVKTFTITNDGGTDLNWNLGPQQTVVNFSKADNADWTLPENQDRISDNVWLTRGTREPLFNIALETSSNRSTPADTEWALGTTASVLPGSYTTFRNIRNQIPNRLRNLAGQTLSLHIISEDTYYDITFSKWTSGSGGGFAYTRTFAGGGVSKSWVYIAKESGVLAAGATETINVSFNPTTTTTAGLYQNDIVFRSNDPDGVEPGMPLSLSIGGVITSAPTADVLVQEGVGTHTVDISSIFTAAAGRTLTYTVTSDAAVVTGVITGTTLTLTEVGTGSSDVVISANDGFGGTGSDTFAFRINATPVASQMSDALYPFGFTSSIINLAGVFSDTDNDFLTLSATSSDPTIVDVAVVGNDLTITEVGSGDATIRLQLTMVLVEQ